MDLEVGDAEAHHGIGHGVAPGEHVLDLLAGVDEPGRDLPRLHGVLHLVGEALALSDPLHDLEGQGRLHAVDDEIVHDVVPGAEDLLQLGDAVDHQGLRVVEPHVRAVSQTRDADQLLHGGGPGLLQDLLDEAGAEFRHAQGAHGAFEGGKVHVEGLRGGIDLPGLRVVQGNGGGVDARQVLEHAKGRGIVVAQDVQLHQAVVHGVEVEVGGDGPLLHLVRRVLDGREHVDVLVLGHDDDARRVLARGHLHVEAALAEALDLRPAQGLASDLGVVVHALEALLFRDAGDGARPVGVVLAEHLLHVLVGPVLVLAGEVEVDIGGLVPLEAQEDLEGDLEPVLF